MRERKINRPFSYEYNKKVLFSEILLMLNNSQMFIQEKKPAFIAIKLRGAFYLSNLWIRKLVTQLFKQTRKIKFVFLWITLKVCNLIL